MGVKSEIPVGAKFNKLVVLRELQHTYHPNGKMKRLVEVQCDCGEVVSKSWGDVKRGAQKTCGLCKKEGAVRNLTGLRVNRLTVTENYYTENKSAIWECVCDCGTKLFVDGRRLRNKQINNCGICGTPKGAYYIGDKFKNNEGYEVTVVGIGSNRMVTVQTEDGGTFQVDYANTGSGNFKNPFHRSVAGTGYYGVGPYIAKSGRGEEHTEEYEDWNSMIKRCYAEASRKHSSSYDDKEVCEEWHNFQVFAEWATKQIGFNQPDYHLDKDLLVKGNLVYGPETCVYLPREVNMFIKRKRLNNLPLGVDIAYNYDRTPYYRSQAREAGKNVCLGRFSVVEDAFNAYKVHKERLAKELAQKWEHNIDQRAFGALMNYTVDIND